MEVEDRVMDEVVNFTRMEDGTYDEYQLLMRKYEPLVRNLPNEVISSLKMLAGDAVLRPYISEGNHWLIKHHAIFQGYYYFHHVGLDRMEREKFRGHPMFQRTADFCEKWDQNSFDAGYGTMPLEAFEPMLRRLFARKPFTYGAE